MAAEEETKPETDEEEKQRKEYEKSPLLLEYEMAQEMHNYYGKISWEIISIFIAGSLALVGFSLQSPLITREGFIVVPITVTLVMIALYFLYNRIAQLVNIHLARLWQIEETLHFHQHRNVGKAHDDGCVMIGKKCYPLCKPRGGDSIKFLIFFIALSVWLIYLALNFL